MNKHATTNDEASQPRVEEIAQQARNQCEHIIDFCTSDGQDVNFFSFEKSMVSMLHALGVVYMQLFLASAHQRLDYSRWLSSGLYYLKSGVVYRTIKTAFGQVRYGRSYMVRKGRGGGGFYPLDAVHGLTSDGFSPMVMNLAAKLATRVRFQTAVLLFRSFYGWSPCSATIQELVLGMGREAGQFMEHHLPGEEEGEVLVMEVDGKATPTATPEELKKRRGKRRKKASCGCNCQRHRSRAKRSCCRRKRRAKDDKSKNGRSITLVVMYTLRRGSDGKLHGPINKEVWGSYGPRRLMFAWARARATKRGFAPGTDRRVHIVVDGEKCLRQRMEKEFPEATFALDIRHVEGKIWALGRAFHKAGSEALEQWVDERRARLYSGQVELLIEELQALLKSLSSRAKRDQAKREALEEVLGYLEPRVDMMGYKKLIDEDLVIASGIVEGAARYVVGDRMDGSGMRWIPGRAQALLHLRCIELNGDWDQFFDWGYRRWMEKLKQQEKVLIKTDEPIDLPDVA